MILLSLLFYSSDISFSFKSTSIQGVDFLLYYIKIGLYFVRLHDFNFFFSTYGLIYVILLLKILYLIIPHKLRVLHGFFQGDQYNIQFKNLLDMTYRIGGIELNIGCPSIINVILSMCTLKIISTK